MLVVLFFRVEPFSPDEDPPNLLEDLRLVRSLVHADPDAFEAFVTQLDHDVGDALDIPQPLFQPCHVRPIIPVPVAAVVSTR